MSDSEILQRKNDDWMDSEKLRQRIVKLLNHPKINQYSSVDAYYYDYSTLPDEQKHSIGRDAYFCFGITSEREFVSKWIDRYDVDSNYPIENGVVIRPEKEESASIPEIKMSFNEKLLSTPMPYNIFGNM